jgi:DNA-binding FadR family transcriptional regulator
MNQLDAEVAMIAIEPVQKRRLSSKVAETLRNYIVERALQPGDSLPPERDLAAALAVSRNVLREALRLLEEQGVITVNHGASTMVRDWLPALRLADSAEAKRQLAASEAAREARAVFESSLVELIIERATAADMQRLEQIVRAIERCLAANRPSSKEDIAFHEQLLRCTHNPELLKVGRTIVLKHLRASLMQGPMSSPLESPETVDLDEHVAIVAAIRRHDIQGLHRLLRFHGYPMDSPERAQAGLLPYWARPDGAH